MVLNQRKFGDYWFFSTQETKKHMMGNYNFEDPLDKKPSTVLNEMGVLDRSG